MGWACLDGASDAMQSPPSDLDFKGSFSARRSCGSVSAIRDFRPPGCWALGSEVLGLHSPCS